MDADYCFKRFFIDKRQKKCKFAAYFIQRLKIFVLHLEWQKETSTTNNKQLMWHTSIHQFRYVWVAYQRPHSVVYSFLWVRLLFLITCTNKRSQPFERRCDCDVEENLQWIFAMMNCSHASSCSKQLNKSFVRRWNWFSEIGN